jgi:hypothetical protein
MARSEEKKINLKKIKSKYFPGSVWHQNIEG